RLPLPGKFAIGLATRPSCRNLLMFSPKTHLWCETACAMVCSGIVLRGIRAVNERFTALLLAPKTRPLAAKSRRGWKQRRQRVAVGVLAYPMADVAAKAFWCTSWRKVFGVAPPRPLSARATS